MPQQTVCMWFDGQGEEAAGLYTAVFPNSRITDITRYGPGMAQAAGSVMTVSFELDGRPYLALNGGPQFTFSEAVSVQIHCDGQDEVDRYWSLLSEGGQEGPCGWLKDRYGFSWQVIPTRMLELLRDPDPGRAHRATQAMLRMGKIDIAELEAAAAAA